MTTTDGWTVTLTLDIAPTPTAEDLDRILDELAPHGAALAVGPDDGRLEVTLSIETDEDPIHASMKALDVTQRAVRGISALDALEVVSFAEHDRRLAEPAFPELVGISEIAELLGVTRQRASSLQEHTGFPSPVAQLRSGPVWRKGDLSRFAATWERKPGRPPKAAAAS